MSDDSKHENPVPATLDTAKPASPLSQPQTVITIGQNGEVIVKTADAGKKPDDKKKMPRGSSTFRHA
ncbi:MAG TPA: hypothetical protein VGG48_15505 [Rhizomicrobium sp.]|jgi:hypothetical protein